MKKLIALSVMLALTIMSFASTIVFAQNGTSIKGSDQGVSITLTGADTAQQVLRHDIALKSSTMAITRAPADLLLISKMTEDTSLIAKKSDSTSRNIMNTLITYKETTSASMTYSTTTPALLTAASPLSTFGGTLASGSLAKLTFGPDTISAISTTG